MYLTADLFFVNGTPFLYFAQTQDQLYSNKSSIGKKIHRDIQGFQNDFKILPKERFPNYYCARRWRICGITEIYSRNAGGGAD